MPTTTGSPPCRSATRRGKRVRRKVTGRTKTEVKLKLRELRRDLDSGIRSSATHSVGDALDDWLANGLSGRSDRTRELYRDTVAAQGSDEARSSSGS